MQLKLHIPSPNQHWDAIHRILSQKSAAKLTLALRKNLGFQLFSPKTHGRKTFVHRKFRPRSITTLPMQISKGILHEYLKKNCVKVKKRSGQCRICFEKFPLFFTKTGRKNSGQKISQHAAQLNGAPSIDAKTLAFPSILWRQN